MEAAWRRFFGGQLGFWTGKTRIGESIAQRSRRPQRGWRLHGRVLGGQLGFWTGKTRIRESIAQRSRRPQRGMEAAWRSSLVDSLASGREKRASGKASHRGHGGHRGDGGCMEEVLWWTAWFLGGKTRIRESIAQRSRRPQRGMEAAWRRFFGGQLGFWAGKRASWKASHRGRGGHRGGLKLDGGRFFDGQCGSGREKHSSGRHRTEVTDGAAGYATLFSV